MDIPTWTITVDERQTTMIVRALEQTIGGREPGLLRDFNVGVLSDLKTGKRSITGDKVELADLCDTVDVLYATKAAGGGPVAGANCETANKWANEVYKHLLGKPDGKRGKPAVKKQADLFWDD